MKGLVIFSGSKPNMKNLQAWSTENKKAAIVVNHLFNKTCRKIYAIKTWGEFCITNANKKVFKILPDK